MKKLFGIVLIAVCFGLCAFTCDESDDGDVVTEFSPITSTTLPDEGKVNQSIEFVITHRGSNGCAQYSHNKTVTKGRDVFVTFFNSYKKDSFCTYALTTLETSYSYKPSAVGEYTFHFKQEDGKYQEEKITISE
ncbi:hypothetical protein [Pseudochryseolinea flava]|uniref:GOLD domain-containing protein n=1 Tax=Pseudochryseolinea flava TaxID=2059302 RepID=A0A364XUS5_9BACT|nr:hypothetical protein [Pseudochryseolinea flava]RAV98056.1 hypothetical protein DQQ10_25310 [Pseudochryseolinea flava]